MITVSKNGKVKMINAWQSLGHDVNIECGGLFANPDLMEGIEVIDLDSAAGVSYCNLIIRGSFYVDLDKIQQGGECCGVDQITIDRIKRVWKVFSKHYFYHMFVENHPIGSTSNNLLLEAFYCSHAYMGFDGYTNNTLILPKKTRNTNDWDSYTENQAKELSDQWQADYILTTNPVREIKRILREEGIRIK